MVRRFRPYDAELRVVRGERLLKQGALPVPAEHKSAVDELIKAHTAVAT